MLGFAPDWVELSARRMLARLQDRIGGPGRAASAAVPGLTAAMDQHAAAVRDILAAGVDDAEAVVSAVLLAGYARGLLDQSRELGGTPAVPGDWRRADWLTMRLLAVCHLARGPLAPQG